MVFIIFICFSLFDDVFHYFSLIFQCFKDVLYFFFACWVDVLQFTCIFCIFSVHGRHRTVENSKFWNFRVSGLNKQSQNAVPDLLRVSRLNK